MIVLCNGMPRSASTWSFNVCRRLFQLLRPQDSLCARYHENIAEVIDPLVGSYDHLVLKCHSLDERGRELCLSGRSVAIYTHRDPYDAISSIMTMFGHPFESALESIRHSLDLREFHRATGHSHIVAYDSIRNAPLDAVVGIAEHLGLDPSADQFDRIVHETSVDAMKAIADQVDPERGAIRTPKSMYDPETHVHRNHIRDGGTGYGRVRLSPEQARRVEEVLVPYLMQVPALR
jgi:hypothetical protein